MSGKSSNAPPPDFSVGNTDASLMAPESKPLDSNTGAGFRAMVYSHDTFGLGHLRRCLKIAEGLSSRYPQLSILLATGSPVVHRFDIPAGLDYIKLPSVRKTGREHYEARVLQMPFDRILELRSRILLETARNFAPHFLLVDHSPSGMKGEMLPALDWLRRHHPTTTTVLGLRDILDDPESVRVSWQESGIWDLLEHAYDRILVYGSQAVFDVSLEYGFGPDLCSKTTYCNYVADNSAGVHPENQDASTNPPHVLITVGGGDGAVDTVIEPYLEMLGRYAHELEFESTILTGPFISESQHRRLAEMTAGLPVTLMRFTPDTSQLLKRSALVISTGGYNTMTEVLGAARRSIVIPRMLHRNEQLIRAQRLAKLGLVTLMHPSDVTAARLYDTVVRVIRDEAMPLVEARRRGQIPLDGNDRIAEVWGALMKSYAVAGGSL